MTFYGLISLRPNDRKERKNIKNIIEVAYRGKVEPVPRVLRKDFAEEARTSFYRDQLVWLIGFPSDREYDALMNKMTKFKIDGIFPIVGSMPEAILKMRVYKCEMKK
jgi:hypothetical protein